MIAAGPGRPEHRAASTNACSFSERTEARISRANDGTPTTVIASIALEIDGPSVATIASASKTAGKAKMTSRQRISKLSRRPP